MGTLNQSSRLLTFCVVGLSIIVSPVLTGRSAQAFSLGPAQGYNLFVLGDVTQDTIHSQGKIAVGGNITSTLSYGIATNLPSGDNLDNLIVGGNVNLGSNGQVNGRTVYGGTVNANSTQGTIQQTPINFAAASNAFTALSNQLRALNGTDIATLPNANGLIVLSGNRSDYNVFNLLSSQLTNTVRYQIQTPSDSQTIVNILGDNVNLANGNFTFEVDEAQRSRLLYNFNASQLTAQSVGFRGSILAPQTTFNADNGQIVGTGIFANVREIPGVGGTFEYNLPAGGSDNLFVDSPTGDQSGGGSNSVPTPALLPGILAIAGRMWRRSHKVKAEQPA
jgi:choice-of-anchor A domain-containing protein